MPIHVPGKRDRRGRKSATKRKVVAVLSLTAMVDLFTVLVVFLLQNYNVTGEIIEIPKDVELPKAKEVRALKPANVVIVSPEFIKVNNVPVIPYQEVAGSSSETLSIPRLKEALAISIKKSKEQYESLQNKIKKAMKKIVKEQSDEEMPLYKKVTIQADKDVSFLVIKKVMYTITEAIDSLSGEGVAEINFAVLKKDNNKQSP
ncbi:MAG: adventurous gliding motility protein S [Bdellovibrio sp.]|nr:MAG: adventurous gliding motility protein S [Bdellovibrio sp.]